MIKFYIMLSLVLMSCNNKKFSTKSEHKINQITKVLDSLSFEDLILLGKNEAILKYGNPASSERFILDDAQGEFRNNIIYSYSEEERLSESIIIDELTWEKDSLNFITLWYEGVKVKSYLIWGKGFEF